MKKIFLIIFFFILILSLFFFLSGGLIFFNRKFKKAKALETIGFLPYWNLTEDLKIDFELLDQLIYFSLMVDENGEFIKDDPGWTAFKSPELADLLKKIKQEGNKNLLCVASFEAEAMYQIVSNPEKGEKLISQTIALVKENDFDGVDMDFEYFEQVNHKRFGERYNTFLAKLKDSLDEINPDLILSVDIYPKAIIENEPYQLMELGEIVDQVIIMAYDYTQSNSKRAGPIAPIRTDPDLDIDDNYSILQTLKAVQDKLPEEKVILGIPLYGYQWQTRDEKHRSKTIPNMVEMVSYAKMQQLLLEHELDVVWDATSSSPWTVYQEKGNFWQIYFENLKSLQLKFQLAKLWKLKGLAFWALGYEGDNEEIWHHLKTAL